MIKAVIFDMFETLITHYQSPLYFSAQMAEDAAISVAEFRKYWDPTESDRSIGKLTFEETIRMVLQRNGCYSQARLDTIAAKRSAAKVECFRHLHPQILPMLARLRERGISIGLISNCFSEEVGPIRQSVLFPYFDAVCLSYEEKVQKPDVEIFVRCMERLSVKAAECIYVGDGGSFELETADRLGMNALQAVWYLQEGTVQILSRKLGFDQLEKPLDVLTRL